MKWITRENAAVDRIACPWLIRRWIDPDAEFLFVPGDRVMAVAAETGATPFDVEGAALGHVDGRCSFESIVLAHGLGGDAALARVARVVHGADVAEDRAITPESAGLEAIAHGFRLLWGRDDRRKMELEFPMYDALYRWAESRVAAEGAADRAGATGGPR
jgi:hypothetical protein